MLGADREKFLHGQVTNDILKLRAGQGIRAALVNAKGRLEADLLIYKLPDELLLDFEPGLSEKIKNRLERYVIAEDVQVADVAGVYGLLSLQGPGAAEVLGRAGFGIPAGPREWKQAGDNYLMANDRFGTGGFDLFAPVESTGPLRAQLEAADAVPVSEDSAETVRIENGIPRFGRDMDETNLAPETGLEKEAISYAKGCYIGQEVIARIRTYGQVAKALRTLRIAGAGDLPPPGGKLLHDGKEVGRVTSFAYSPKLQGRAGLGYVRKEANAPGTKLSLETGESVEIAGLPR